MPWWTKKRCPVNFLKTDVLDDGRHGSGYKPNVSDFSPYNCFWNEYLISQLLYIDICIFILQGNEYISFLKKEYIYFCPKKKKGVYIIPKQIKYSLFSFLTTEHILLHPQKKKRNTYTVVISTSHHLVIEVLFIILPFYCA